MISEQDTGAEMVLVNGRTGKRRYLDGERAAAGARLGYAHLEPGDVIDPGANLEAFGFIWTHIPTGKTGTNIVACLDRADFLRYLARWNAIHPETWRYTEEARRAVDGG